MLKQLIKRSLDQVPYIARLKSFETMYPPGHFYSPIPGAHGIELASKMIEEPLCGIDLNPGQQLEFFGSLAPLIQDNVFTQVDPEPGVRFHNRNGFYGFGDAQTLQAILRHRKPARVIEAGSGFTSALMFEVNQRYFQGAIDLKFIEPYPERLRELFSDREPDLTSLLIQERLEDVDVQLFQELEAGDILFVDSSHVLKAGSDLYVLFFRILPLLAPGVYVHFHDIFDGFHYPPNHYETKKGFGWNESYFLRSFLMDNPRYEIVLFVNYLDRHFEERLRTECPKYLPNTGGAFWMRKVG